MRYLLIILSLFLFSCDKPESKLYGTWLEFNPETGEEVCKGVYYHFYDSNDDNYMMILGNPCRDIFPYSSTKMYKYEIVHFNEGPYDGLTVLNVQNFKGEGDIYHHNISENNEGFKVLKIHGVDNILNLKLNGSSSKAPIYKKAETKQKVITPKRKTDREIVAELKSQDCVKFISLLSAKEVAREFGWTESKVLRSHRINLWGKTSPNGKFPKVGEMYPGSNAMIIDRIGDDFKVISPLDNSIGWVNRVQIDKIRFLNPNTFEKCKKEFD